MTTSPFAFLQTEWPAVHESAAKAAVGDAVFNKARVILQIASITSTCPVLWIISTVTSSS